MLVRAVPVEKPEIRISKSFLDFGIGFYTTTSLQQAERWARSVDIPYGETARFCEICWV